MKLIRQNLWSPGCLRCGSWAVQRSLFCEICWNDRIQARLKSGRSGVQHCFLLDWGSSDPNYLDQLVYRLKSNLSVKALQFYTDLLFEYCCENIKFSDYSALVPIPGSRPSSVHSEIIARRISHLTGVPVVSGLLYKISAEEQKSLTLARRKEMTSFDLDRKKLEEFTKNTVSPSLGDRKYLFVDDVLTSGNSYKQCSALLSPGFAAPVLTLFYRRRNQL